MANRRFGVLDSIRFRLPLGRRLRVGEYLLREGLISRDQLAVALEHQQRKGSRIGYHLVKLGMIDEETLGAFLAERFGVPAVGDESFHVHLELFSRIPPSLLRNGEIFPLHRAGATLTLVMCDPTDEDLIAEVSRRTGLAVNTVVAPQAVIQRHLAHYFALQEIREKLGTGDEGIDLSRFFGSLRDFRFQNIIGVGGFGVVCRCWQISLDRPVAVKTMSRQLSEMDGMIERFKREGRIIAHLNHPNIIQVYEQGELGGLFYIVMEYFDGQPLDLFCRDKDLAERLTCLVPICDALHFAFKKGVVHRDLKPGNILANDAGEVKLLDFGIARFDKPGESRLTQRNIVLGTPKYMAPECLHGGAEASVLTDIYAMGVLIYELLTGVEPSKPHPAPPNVLNALIPSALSKALLRALEPEPSKRLESFDLLKRALLHSRDMILMGSATRPLRFPQGESAPPTPTEFSEDFRRCYAEERVLRDDELVRVFVARHRQMDRRVVIRRIRARIHKNDAPARLSEVKHPHIGQVLGCGTDGNDLIVVTEHLGGGSLADRMQLGPISREDYVAWCHDMVSALKAAREKKIPHGRLHPGNILFTQKGQLKVVDFRGEAEPRSARFPRFTRPEIADPWELDRYALGVMWFEMLTGDRFRGASSYAQNFQKVQHSSQIDSLLKIPLGRLWGIPRYGPRYENYDEILDDLQIVREKLDPATLAAARARLAQSAARKGTSLSLQIAYVLLAIAALFGIGAITYLLSSL